ncbi:hypothetical protein E0L36_22155 [Streptomyces sp. AJS327]|uniref:hypothetical protein n=1 Tax=Streptomyces sp. AJS327 TaxID=2545265 RepID=UPI0015DE73B0|nr:hypothetical protein [Streptomyces sp. AJS327]MBA0053481.1 hypothetical protein [Streptomyces sp. AJS327]
MSRRHRPDSQQDRAVPPDSTPGRSDAARTSPIERPDGVRVEYRARVPRHLVGAAFAEALAAIGQATRSDTAGQVPDNAGEPPDTADAASDDTARAARPGGVRRAQVRDAINDAFDIPSARTTPRRSPADAP